MDIGNLFTLGKPINQFLSTIVDNYFFIDAPVSELSPGPEYMIPFPRITFGYFFNHPFNVTNLTLNQSVAANMIISRVSTHKIIVQPQTDRIKIIGAHVKPICLAYLTRRSINELPWVINAIDLFPKTACEFQKRIEKSKNVAGMFEAVEWAFLNEVLVRDLSLITKAIDLIEQSAGNISISKLSHHLGVTDRTIRNQFYDCIGCSPKEYIRIVKLRQVAFQMKHSNDSLTSIAYNNEYFDQAHFIHEIRDITGHSPKQLKMEIPDFRFLQF